MSLPTGYPSEDAEFAGIAFFELNPDSKAYAPVPNNQEFITVGQTIITRYTQPKTVTIPGLCGITEADAFDAYDSGSDVLIWHFGTSSFLPTAIETKRIPSLGVAEVTLTGVLL